MTKPTNLPENLNSVRERLIDYAFGRMTNLPTGADVDEFVAWIELDDSLLAEGREALAFDMLAISQRGFDDFECADYEGLDEEELTDEIRLAYAKKRMKFLLDEVDPDVNSLLGAELENDKSEIAYFCAVMKGNAFEGFEVGQWDVFKDFETFKNKITSDGNLILAENLDNAPIDVILKWWKKDQTQADLPKEMPADLKVLRDRIITAVHAGENIAEEDLKRLEDYFHYENFDYLEYGCIGFNLENFMGNLSFREVADELDVQEEDLTNDLILSYLRSELSNLPDDSPYENTAMTAILSNKEGKSVYMGFLANWDADPESDLEALGVYKTKRAFEDSLDQGRWFIQEFDVDDYSDKELLALWNIHAWTATKQQAKDARGID